MAHWLPASVWLLCFGSLLPLHHPLCRIATHITRNHPSSLGHIQQQQAAQGQPLGCLVQQVIDAAKCRSSSKCFASHMAGFVKHGNNASHQCMSSSKSSFRTTHSEQVGQTHLHSALFDQKFAAQCSGCKQDRRLVVSLHQHDMPAGICSLEGLDHVSGHNCCG